MIIIDGKDYEGGEFLVIFPINVTRVSLNITIINDDEPPVEEEREMFDLDLPPEDLPRGVRQGGTGVVRITEDCTRVCQNGGDLDTSSCTCTCPPPYTGINCESEQLFDLFHECNYMFIHSCTGGHL